MRAASKLLKKEGKTIALVPTMGYLHEGHMSLVHGIRKKCDFLVSSIFINPAQFAEGEDLDRYPADPERDKRFRAALEKVNKRYAPALKRLAD